MSLSGHTALPADDHTGSSWSRTSQAWLLPDPLPPMQDTVVGEILLWGTRKPSAQAISDLGFDPFLYHLRNRPVPTAAQFLRLAETLSRVARDTPEDLYRAVFFEQLDELLGDEFSWVQFPATKRNIDTTLPPSRQSKPW